MNDAIRQLLAIAPGIASGLKGNGPEMQAFMEAYQRTKAQLDQQAMQRESFALQKEDRTRGIARQETADARATEQYERGKTQQGQADALQRLAIPGQLAELGGTAQDPQSARAMIESAMPGLMSAFGPETMAMGEPAVAMAEQTITARQKRQMKEFVDAALKTAHIADNPDSDPDLTNLPSHIQKILGKPTAKLSEVQAFADLPIGKPAGKERMPAAAGSMEEFSDPTITPERKAQILKDRQAYMQSDDRPRVTVNTGSDRPPAQQRRIDAIVKGFDAQPITKRTTIMSEGVGIAQSLKDDTTNPADDQALIYAFAKVMDPESVVRESEYETVRKYGQSLAERFGFNAQRVFSNTAFLTPEARKNMKQTLMTKFGVEQRAYDNLRKEYGRKIDRITKQSGTGVDELTDFGAAFPQAETPSASAPQFTVGQKVRNKTTGEVREVTGVRPDGKPILGPVKQ